MSSHRLTFIGFFILVFAIVSLAYPNDRLLRALATLVLWGAFSLGAFWQASKARS